MISKRNKVVSFLILFIKLRIKEIKHYYKNDNPTVKKLLNGTSIEELKHMLTFLSKIK